MNRPRSFPHRFVMVREHDPTGVSGVGRIADGVRFDDGTAVLHWHGSHACTVVWRSIDDVIAVHGHGQSTRLAWLEVPAYGADQAAAFGRGAWGQ